MMADGATDQGAAVGDHAAAAAEPETASDLIPRRVSHKLKEQHDWNVMRGQPPVTALQVLVLLPLVLARATLAVVGLLCVALFWQLAVLEARCARMCCRARSGCKALNTCSFWVLGKLFLFCFGLWTRVEVVGGPPARGPVAALVRGAPFLVCNHACYFDAFVLLFRLKGLRFIAKAGVQSMPLIGTVATHIDTVFVDRGDKESKRGVFEALADHVESWSEGELPICAFPESTTTNAQALIPFKKGLFAPGRPVTPVIVVYKNGNPCGGRYRVGHPQYVSYSGGAARGRKSSRVSPKGDADGGGAGGAASGGGPPGRDPDERIVDYSDGKWFLRLLTYAFVRCKIKVYPTYHPSEEEIRVPEVYAENVWKYMQGLYEQAVREF